MGKSLINNNILLTQCMLTIYESVNRILFKMTIGCHMQKRLKIRSSKTSYSFENLNCNTFKYLMRQPIVTPRNVNVYYSSVASSSSSSAARFASTSAITSLTGRRSSSTGAVAGISSALNGNTSMIAVS